MIPTARIPLGGRRGTDLAVAACEAYQLRTGHIFRDPIPWVTAVDESGRRLRLPTYAVLIDTAPIPDDTDTEIDPQEIAS